MLSHASICDAHHRKARSQLACLSVFHLCAAQAREQAAALLLVGQLLAQRHCSDSAHALVDVWLEYVMPMAVSRG